MLALTHVPSPNLAEGQRTCIDRVPIDYDLAVQQHAQYCAALRSCGVDVHVLDVNRHLPDAVFVEDTAVVLDEVAVLTSMGTEARRGELPAIALALEPHRPLVSMKGPATLEGGDVLRVGRRLLVGLSVRTNLAGLKALEEIVSRYGYRVLPVPVHGCLHLKTAGTALPDGSLLVNPSWLDMQALQSFTTVFVPEDEPWGANTLPVGDVVLLAAEHPQTANLLRRLGLDVCPVPLSEFAKAEGGVTCLSLLLEGTHSS